MFRGVDDRNDVTVAQDFDDAETAGAMLASAEIRAAMADAGVAGPPSVWLVEPAG